MSSPESLSPHFLAVPRNRDGRDYVVGDLHGQAAMLALALDSAGFDPRRDRLFALGDLVDRGPESAELLRRFAAEPWFYSLRGNHEAMLQAVVRDAAPPALWYRNGGSWAQALDREQLLRLAEIVDAMPIAMEIELDDGRRIGLIHAEVAAGAHWSQVRAIEWRPSDGMANDGLTFGARALWGRERIFAYRGADSRASEATSELAAPTPGIDALVVGHTVMPGLIPVQTPWALYLDTGAYLPTGRLSLLDLRESRYLQIDNGQGRPWLRQSEQGPWITLESA